MNSFTFNQQKYKLSPKALGSGEYATVFLATSEEGQQIAIKKYKTSNNNTQKSKDRTKTLEYDILKYMLTQPNHHNVIKFLGFLDENSLAFEFCEKGEFLKYLGTVNEEQTEEFMKCVFVQWISGLHYLQTRDNAIVHRDLKLANILVDRKYGKNIFKIADFGFASNKHSLNDMYTSFYGTPKYTAQEIHNQEPYGVSIDIFSLGRCLYDSLANSREQIIGQFNFEYIQDKSNNYQDLISRMLEAKDNRITLEEIIKHPWITSKTVTIKLIGINDNCKKVDSITIDDITKYFYQDLTVNQFSDIIGIDLNNNTLLCSYSGRDGFNTLQDNVFYPIYTIESIIIISKDYKPIFKNFSVEPLVFYTKNNQESPDNTIDFINEGISILEYLLSLYDGYSIFKFIRNFINDFRNNNNDSRFNIERFLQNINMYKSTLENIKNLKEIDIDGNETNNLVFDGFPLLLKSFITNTNIAKIQDLLSSMDHILSIDFKQLDKLFIEFLDQFDANEKLDELRNIKEIFQKKVTTLRNPEQDAIINEILVGVIDRYSKFTSKPITTSIKLCLNTPFFMKVYLDIDQVYKFTLITLLKEIDVYKEISKIPQLYQIYKTEVKRRNVFNSEFKKLTSSYQQKLHYINQLEKKQQFGNCINNNNQQQQQDDELNDFILIGDCEANLLKLKKENQELMNCIDKKKKEMDQFKQIYPFKYLYQLLDIVTYQDLDSPQYQSNAEMRMLAAKQLKQIREIEQSYIELYDSTKKNVSISNVNGNGNSDGNDGNSDGNDVQPVPTTSLETIKKETIDNRIALESFIEFNHLDISTKEKQEKLDQLKLNIMEKETLFQTITRENGSELHRFKLSIDQEQSNLSKLIKDKQDRLTLIKQQLDSINLGKENQELLRQKEKITLLEDQILKLKNTINNHH